VTVLRSWKGKGVDLYFVIMKHISKVLGVARAEGITQYYLPHAHLSTNEKSHPACCIMVTDSQASHWPCIAE